MLESLKSLPFSKSLYRKSLYRNAIHGVSSAAPKGRRALFASDSVSVSVAAIVKNILLLFLFFVQFSEASDLRFIIFRHGEAEHNVKRLFNSNLEESLKYPLTEKGKKQVKESARRLKEEYHLDPSKVVTVYVSPLLRTKQTAEVLVNELGIDQSKLVIEPLIIESDNGRIDGTSVEEFAYGKDGMDHARAHEYGGETDEDVSKRMIRFVEKVNHQHSSGDVLVVTHGTPAMQLYLLLSKKTSIPGFIKAEFRVIESVN